MNEYTLYVKLNSFEIDGFLHANDLSYTGSPKKKNLKLKRKNSKLKS